MSEVSSICLWTVVIVMALFAVDKNKKNFDSYQAMLYLYLILGIGLALVGADAVVKFLDVYYRAAMYVFQP